ncbi:hypothetical protein H4I96_11409 [Botrytis cinerea]
MDCFPPKKRICLDLHHYAIPTTPADSDIAVQQDFNVPQQRETSLDRFNLFRWLPKELQLEIWKVAAADIDAQIVTIDTKVHPSMKNCNASVDTATTSLTAQYRIPSLLHACADAREVALKYYRPVFGREIGGAPIYIAIDNLRASDTICFKNLNALKMLRSCTRNFNQSEKNDMDFIKSAIVCMEVHNGHRENYRSIRWITSSLREVSTLWIAQEKSHIHSHKQNLTAFIVKHLSHLLAEVMIEQHATLQQKEKFVDLDSLFDEIIRCVENTNHSIATYGFELPRARITSVDELNRISEQSFGTGAQSLASLDYLQKLLR